MKLKNTRASIKVILLAIIIILAVLILLLFMLKQSGKIQFGREKGIEDQFAEIEELVSIEDSIDDKKMKEQSLESDLEQEQEEPVKSLKETETDEISGRQPEAIVLDDEPDLFDEDLFQLQVEKTAEEKRHELIKNLLIQAKAQIEAGNFTDTAITCTQILRIDPENQDATNYMYLALSSLRQSEAKANLTKQIEVLFDKAKLLYEEKVYDESLKEFKKIIELEPSHIIAAEYIEKINDITSGETAKRLAEEREKKEEARKKTEEKRRAEKELMKSKTPELIKEAKTFLDKKEYKKAINIYEQILAVYPYNKKILDLFAKTVRQKSEEEKRISLTKDSLETEQRFFEVDKASIPAKPDYGSTEEKEGVVEKFKKEEDKKPKGALAKIAALKEKAQQLVSLDFENADLRDVIRFLVEQTQINIVIDETVLRGLSSAQSTAMPAAPMMMPVVSPFGQPPAVTTPGAPGMGAGISSQTQSPQTSSIFGAMPGMGTQGGAVTEQTAAPNILGAGGYTLAQPQAGMLAASIQPQAPDTAKVTIYLINVALEKALDAVLRSKGLAYKIEEDIIWISTKKRLEHEELKVEVFTLKHALGTFKNFAGQSLSVGNETGGGGSREQEADISPFLFGGGASSQGREDDMWALELGEAETQESTEREGDIRDILIQFVPQPEGSAIAYYQKVGKLLVRNTPSNIELVRQILESLDISSYQVAIEARILEVSSFEGEDIGVSWENVTWEKDAPSIPRKIEAGLTHGAGSFGKDETIEGGLSLKYTTLDAVSLEATLSALLKTKKGNMLSAPKLTCLNNQTANIRVATNYKYVARWELDVSGYDQYAREFRTPVIADLDEGIVLNVTPHVNDESMTITLVVEPTINELIEFTSIGDPNYPNQLPKTTIRSLQTTVTIKNNQTLVMGGLMKNEEKENIRKIPLLGSIPVLGHFFKSTTKYNTKSDLLIFITATILNSEGQIVTEKIEKGEVISDLIK